MKRLLVWMTALSLLLAACGGTADHSAPDIETSEGENDTTAQNTENNSQNVDQEEENPTEDTTATGAGKYINLIDASTIEIETAGETQKYQLSAEAQEDIEYIEAGEEVKFTYYEQDDQKIIDFIENVAYYDELRHHHRDHKHHRHHRHHEGHRHHGTPSNWKE